MQTGDLNGGRKGASGAWTFAGRGMALRGITRALAALRPACGAALALVVLMTALVAGGGVAVAGDRPGFPAFSSRSPVIAAQGAAATSQPLVTQVALDVLKAGGSAVDAAIAADAALGLMEPTGSGIGGDLFALVWDPRTQKLYGLNASGTAPRGQTLAQLKAKLKARNGGVEPKTVPVAGSFSVTVPGAVGGWFALNERFGKLPMEEVLSPAIGYARDGFPVSPVIADLWAMNFRRFGKNAAMIEERGNAAATYMIDGHTPKAGEIFRNPDLAETLNLIAQGGADAFYRGPVARTIDAYMKRIKGPLRYADFASFKPEWVEPVSTNYRGYDVWQIPANTQGIIVLEMLNILEGFDLKAMGFDSADRLHVMAEAKKLAFADRGRYLGDPAMAQVPIKGLIDKAYAAQRRALIDMRHAAPAEVDPGKPIFERTDTVYLTVADKDGMMVSLIQSNYAGMGSGLVPDGLGFMLQNRGAQFNLDASHPNAYAPGKRPFHTIIPGFVTKDGKPWMSFGVMGGAMQPQGQVQVLSNIIDLGMDVQSAGDAPRWRHIGGPDPGNAEESAPNTLFLEHGFSPATIAELQRRGHVVKIGGEDVGGYQAILRAENGVYWAASEMRKDGQAAGY